VTLNTLFARGGGVSIRTSACAVTGSFISFHAIKVTCSVRLKNGHWEETFAFRRERLKWDNTIIIDPKLLLKVPHSTFKSDPANNDHTVVAQQPIEFLHLSLDSYWKSVDWEGGADPADWVNALWKKCNTIWLSNRTWTGRIVTFVWYDQAASTY